MHQKLSLLPTSHRSAGDYCNQLPNNPLHLFWPCRVTIPSSFLQSSKFSLKLRSSIQQKNYPVPNLDSKIFFQLVSSWAVTPPGNGTSEHPPATARPTRVQLALETPPTPAPRSSLGKFDAWRYGQYRKFSVKIIFIKKEAKSSKKKKICKKRRVSIHPPCICHLGIWKWKRFPLLFEIIFSLDILGQVFLLLLPHAS